MNNNNGIDNLSWMNLKIFSYHDEMTSNLLHILMDGGITEEDNYSNFTSSRLVLRIEDSKSTKRKISIELGYSELFSLVRQLDSLIIKNIDNAFKTSTTIIIHKNIFKGKKNLRFRCVTNDNERFFQITITDNTNVLGLSEIYIKYNLFGPIYSLLNKVLDNYLNLSINFLGVCNQNRILDNLKIIEGFIKNLYIGNDENTKKVIDSIRSIELINTENNDILDEDIIQQDNTEETNDFKKIFEETSGFNGLSGVSKYIAKDNKTNKITEVTSNKYITNFLKNNFKTIFDWYSHFSTLLDRSDLTLFSPILSLLNFCGIDESERDVFKENKETYISDYYGLYLLKKNIHNFITNGEFKEYPIFRLTNKIDYNSNVGFVCRNLLVNIYIIGDVLFNLHECTNIDKKQYEHYRYLWYFLKNVYSTLIVSLNIDEKEEDYILDDLWNIFLQYEKSGSLDSLKKEYNIMSNGELIINRDIFFGRMKLFYKSISKIEQFTISERLDKFKNNSIPFENIVFENTQEVKVYLIKALDLTALNLKENIDTKDEKLNLFLSCAENYMGKDEVNNIRKSCKNYNELLSYYRIHTMSEQMMKLKRIMDLDIEGKLKRRTEIINEVNKFQENISVTENRVLEEKEEIQYNPDLDVILLGESI